MEKIIKEAESVLLNKRIVSVGYLTEQERDDLGYSQQALCFELEDGTFCYLMCDNEGNDAGALYYSLKESKNSHGSKWGILPTI